MSRDVNPLDLLNPFSPRSPEELAAYRLEICKGCDRYDSLKQTCELCGCFMPIKTAMANMRCPQDLWVEYVK